MELRNTIHFVASYHRQPCHTDVSTVRFIDQGKPGEQLRIIGITLFDLVKEMLVDFKNNLQMPRKQSAE